MEEQTKVICLDEVDSTNQYLKEHAENLPDGCVVTALHQTAGKGRLGKQWHDREGKSLRRGFSGTGRHIHPYGPGDHGQRRGVQRIL